MEDFKSKLTNAKTMSAADFERFYELSKQSFIKNMWVVDKSNTSPPFLTKIFIELNKRGTKDPLISIKDSISLMKYLMFLRVSYVRHVEDHPDFIEIGWDFQTLNSFRE